MFSETRRLHKFIIKAPDHRTPAKQTTQELEASTHLKNLTAPHQADAMSFGAPSSSATARVQFTYPAFTQSIAPPSSLHPKASPHQMSAFVRTHPLACLSPSTPSYVSVRASAASIPHIDFVPEPVGVSASWCFDISRPHRNHPPRRETTRILHLFRLVRACYLCSPRSLLIVGFQGPTGTEPRLCSHPVRHQAPGYCRGSRSKHVRTLDLTCALH